MFTHSNDNVIHFVNVSNLNICHTYVLSMASLGKLCKYIECEVFPFQNSFMKIFYTLHHKKELLKTK